jgi:hypothetical protein
MNVALMPQKFFFRSQRDERARRSVGLFYCFNTLYFFYCNNIVFSHMFATKQRPARLHRLVELFPWNRFLGSITV